MTLQAADTPLETPITDTAIPETAETPEPAASIADHAAQFSPDRAESETTEEIPKTPANTGQFANKSPDARHKAASQRATPEDVAEINRLTKELRELEAKHADKDPHAKAAPRIKTLQRQIAALKSLETPAAPPVAPKPAEPQRAPVAGEFPEQEPTFEEFSADPQKYPDPLASWMRATARYEARKERWEAQQAETHSAQAAEHDRIAMEAAKAIEAFAATKPDFQAVTAEFYQRPLPPVLMNAVVRSDKRGEFVYHLAQHPELADELVLLTHGKPLEEGFVATVQRRLTKELAQGAAVSTGSAPPLRPYSPPKPPNPVRTGPIKTADEPPAEASSISEHRKHFGPK